MGSIRRFPSRTPSLPGATHTTGLRGSRQTMGQQRHTIPPGLRQPRPQQRFGPSVRVAGREVGKEDVLVLEMLHSRQQLVDGVKARLFSLGSVHHTVKHRLVIGS